MYIYICIILYIPYDTGSFQNFPDAVALLGALGRRGLALRRGGVREGTHACACF